VVNSNDRAVDGILCRIRGFFKIRDRAGGDFSFAQELAPESQVAGEKQETAPVPPKINTKEFHKESPISRGWMAGGHSGDEVQLLAAMRRSI